MIFRGEKQKADRATILLTILFLQSIFLSILFREERIADTSVVRLTLSHLLFQDVIVDLLLLLLSFLCLHFGQGLQLHRLTLWSVLNVS